MRAFFIVRQHNRGVAIVIVLNGTSSSGKSTVAHAFQEIAPHLFLNFSIDSILSALPPSTVERIATGADISDLRLKDLVRAFYGCVGKLLEMGHDLVIDHALTARYHVEALLEATNGHEVLLVGLECEPDVLRERERLRGDRRPGIAVDQRKSIHQWLDYDVLIDTGTLSPAEGAARILSAFASGVRGGFLRTKSRL
jgi:chloramphenicol 3-O phosphotransferase